MSRRIAIPNDCLSCKLRQGNDFCNFPPSIMSVFNNIGHLTLYPANATLISEGQNARGIYIACSGRAKISAQARDGKTLILRIGGDRELFGLSSVVNGGPSAVTVTTIELCQIKFVERESFLRLLHDDGGVALACASILGREIMTCFENVHQLLLARSSTEKLIRLLLSWVATETKNRELRVRTEFTHEEIAQMIGSSRETVTRLFSDLKRKDLIRLEGATLVIPNRIALQAIRN